MMLINSVAPMKVRYVGKANATEIKQFARKLRQRLEGRDMFPVFSLFLNA